MARSRSPSPRPIWKGFLQVGLVSCPVRAFSARVKSASEVDLDWLHRDCHRRIHYKKVCPVHGEVGNDEIVSGYAVGRGRYVEIDPDDLSRLRAKSDKILSIDSIVARDAIDSRQFTEKSYFLLPDGKVAEKPFAVLAGAFSEQDCAGVARVVLFRREQLTILRAVDGAFLITVLNHQEEFQDPAKFAAQAPHPRISPKEREMARALLAAMKDPQFDFGKYQDEYVSQLRKLIHMKVEGQDIENVPVENEPAPLNFMEALRKSVQNMKKGGKGRIQRRPTRRRAS